MTISRSGCQSRMPYETQKQNVIITLLFLITATVCSAAIQQLTKSTDNVTIIYILAVLLIARFTDGYVPGIIASVISVFCVNLAFTYPYMQLDFSIEGYPLTFFGLMLISGITSTTTTHLKEKNRIINEREKLLMEAEKEKMRANLLRAISHDLRTPLTSMIGISSAYLDNGASMTEAERRNMVKMIYEDSNWLLNMVENLLSVTRIRNNQTSVTTSLEPLEEVVSEAIQRFRKRLPDARVQVKIPDEFIMIPMDATLIEQVIINLLENAVYHSKSDIPIDFQVLLQENSALFQITDYGVGIQEELLHSIFDGYSTDANSSGDSRKGMGIGLSICKTIVSAHGGEIYAVNHKNGARFTFTLPLGENSHEPQIDGFDY